MTRQEAVSAVVAWLKLVFGDVESVDTETLSAFGYAGETIGWWLPLPGENEDRLALVLDHLFPYSIPRTFISATSPFLGGPHVEKGGRLCLTGDGGRVDPLDPVGIVRFTYDEATSLLAENATGRNQEDFVDDFEPYWRRETDTDTTVLTLLDNNEGSRFVAAWYGESFFFVAESPDLCRRWMNNRYGHSDTRTIESAAVISLKQLPAPSHYPSSGLSLRALVQRESADGLDVLDELLKRAGARTVVILIARTALGVLVQAPIILRAVERTPNTVYKSGRVADRGFRPGHVPPSIIAMRSHTKRARPERVDAWARRTQGAHTARLVGKCALVLGCGAVGSTVSKLLLQSGVGQIGLIDPDEMAWGNIGRHELGADAVGKSKAEALAAHFRLMYPHAAIDSYSRSWQDAFKEQPDLFNGCDLLVSAIGEWNAEVMLNDLQRSSDSPIHVPIVYGWLEDRATAAHALAVGNEGACLRCGFDRTGGVLVPATGGDSTDTRVCGAPTSMYGAVELMPASALVATLSIDMLLGRASAPLRRAWLAPLPTVESLKRYWSPGWVSKFGDPGAGGKMVATDWPMDEKCPCHPR